MRLEKIENLIKKSKTSHITKKKYTKIHIPKKKKIPTESESESESPKKEDPLEEFEKELKDVKSTELFGKILELLGKEDYEGKEDIEKDVLTKINDTYNRDVLKGIIIPKGIKDNILNIVTELDKIKEKIKHSETKTSIEKIAEELKQIAEDSAEHWEKFSSKKIDGSSNKEKLELIKELLGKTSNNYHKNSFVEENEFVDAFHDFLGVVKTYFETNKGDISADNALQTFVWEILKSFNGIVKHDKFEAVKDCFDTETEANKWVENTKTAIENSLEDKFESLKKIYGKELEEYVKDLEKKFLIEAKTLTTPDEDYQKQIYKNAIGDFVKERLEKIAQISFVPYNFFENYFNGIRKSTGNVIKEIAKIVNSEEKNEGNRELVKLFNSAKGDLERNEWYKNMKELNEIKKKIVKSKGKGETVEKADMEKAFGKLIKEEDIKRVLEAFKELYGKIRGILGNYETQLKTYPFLKSDVYSESIKNDVNNIVYVLQKIGMLFKTFAEPEKENKNLLKEILDKFPKKIDENESLLKLYKLVENDAKKINNMKSWISAIKSLIHNSTLDITSDVKEFQDLIAKEGVRKKEIYGKAKELLDKGGYSEQLKETIRKHFIGEWDTNIKYPFKTKAFYKEVYTDLETEIDAVKDRIDGLGDKITKFKEEYNNSYWGKDNLGLKIGKGNPNSGEINDINDIIMDSNFAFSGILSIPEEYKVYKIYKGVLDNVLKFFSKEFKSGSIAKELKEKLETFFNFRLNYFKEGGTLSKFVDKLPVDDTKKNELKEKIEEIIKKAEEVKGVLEIGLKETKFLTQEEIAKINSSTFNPKDYTEVELGTGIKNPFSHIYTKKKGVDVKNYKVKKYRTKEDKFFYVLEGVSKSFVMSRLNFTDKNFISPIKSLEDKLKGLVVFYYDIGSNNEILYITTEEKTGIKHEGTRKELFANAEDPTDLKDIKLVFQKIGDEYYCTFVVTNVFNNALRKAFKDKANKAFNYDDDKYLSIFQKGSKAVENIEDANIKKIIGKSIDNLGSGGIGSFNHSKSEPGPLFIYSLYQQYYYKKNSKLAGSYNVFLSK